MALPPKNVSEYAKLTLESLAAHGLGDKLSLGGAFGLLHYLDYRQKPTMLMLGGYLPQQRLKKKQF
jgi:hypothetical protein